jgi:hypothetical protein
MLNRQADGLGLSRQLGDRGALKGRLVKEVESCHCMLVAARRFVKARSLQIFCEALC